MGKKFKNINGIYFSASTIIPGLINILYPNAVSHLPLGFYLFPWGKVCFINLMIYVMEYITITYMKVNKWYGNGFWRIKTQAYYD